ncbi:MAG: AIR synthase related protein [Desulfurococcaceae archaeon]
MRTGKLDWKFMSEIISYLPLDDVDVVLGPSQGEDAAVVRIRDGFLVAHSDPITTGVKRSGYLAVHVASNDIAVRGVKPKWFLPVILLPSGFSESAVKELFRDMALAMREVEGVAIGGHTEVTPGITRPIINMTVLGFTRTRVILTRDAKVGDYVYVVGRVGGEGAGIIAWDLEETLLQKKVDRGMIEKAKQYIYEIGVTSVALRIKDYVNSMHDATEGGVLQAIRELAVASRGCIKVHRDRIRLESTVEAITRAVGVNPLKLLSSGCLVATVPPAAKKDFECALEDLKRPYTLVGEVMEGSGELILLDGTGHEIIRDDIVDEIYKLW